MTDKINFDHYAADYDRLVKQQRKFFDKNDDYFAEYKVKTARRLLKNKLCRKILDFGCGTGSSIEFFKEYFPAASICGCDVSEESLLLARKKFPETKFFLAEEAMTSGRQYDLIFLSGVLHHVEPEKRRSLMTSLAGMLVPGGNIIIFEHNPYNPVTCHMVNTCPFDRDAILMRPREMRKLFVSAGIKPLRCDYTLFFPAMFKWLRVLEPSMRHLPFGGQYVVVGEVDS